MYTARGFPPSRLAMMVAEPPDVSPPPDSHSAGIPRLVVSIEIVPISFLLLRARGVEFGFWPPRGRELLHNEQHSKYLGAILTTLLTEQLKQTMLIKHYLTLKTFLFNVQTTITTDPLGSM
ncbi:MAG: hypothetical protein WC817_01295 [Patescibacteria group bacterium]|jgi:hypothetical protein